MLHNDLNPNTQKLWQHIPMQQMCAIQREYMTKIGYNNHLTAPVVLRTPITNHRLSIIDVRGDIWDYHEDAIPKDIRTEFKSYCTQFNKYNFFRLFPILWDNTMYNEKCAVSMIHHKLKMNNKRIKYTSSIKYLGAQLFQYDPSNIVSTILTNDSFLKRLNNKRMMLTKIDFNHSYISLRSRIRILKVFYLVYTEIYAQILDARTINLATATERHTATIKKQTGITTYDPKQFSIFTGIPSPFDRWVVLKISFYWKLLKFPELTYLHRWIRNNPNTIYNYNLYQQFQKLKRLWCPPYLLKDKFGSRMVDPFNEIEKVSELRPKIILKQHKAIISKFHKLHPFNVIQYHLDDYKSYPIFEADELLDFVNKDMITNYYKLFYHFNHSKNYCSLCKSNMDFPIECHLAIYCKKLNHLRHIYWSNAVYVFAKETGQTINNMHNQLFFQKILEILAEINYHKIQLWQIIAGVNAYDNDKNSFVYHQLNPNITLPLYKFLE